MRFFKSLSFLITFFITATGWADFSYPVNYKVNQMKVVQATTDCYIREFKMTTDYPNAPASFQFEGEYYRPKTVTQAIPVVILFPPVGGKNILDEGMAETFCSNDIAVFLPTTDFTGIDQEVIPPIEDHDHALQRVVAASKSIIAYSESNQKLNAQKVGVLGASLGGIVGAFTMAVLPEISAGYFIVAGVDIPAILAHSTQERVVRVKEARRKEVGFKTDDEYEQWLRKYLTYDTLNYASQVPSDMVNLVISNNDKSVPTRFQFLMHQALGKPNYRESSSNHVWTVIGAMSGGGKSTIKTFFEDRFAQPNLRLKTTLQNSSRWPLGSPGAGN